jgi:hypothetical protein
LPVGLPTTAALPVANGRHQTVRSGGDWGRNLFGIKTRKLKLADRDVSSETSAVDLGGAPGGASFEHHSKSENTEPTPRSSSRHSGPGRFTAAQGPLAPAAEIEYFVAHIQPHGSPHLNSASATVPAVGRRNPIIDTGCSDHPRGFSRSSIYGRSSEISRRRRTRLRQQAHFLLRLSMKATIDMAWVERTDPIRYEDHLLERSTRTVIDSFLAVAPYMIDWDSTSGCRAPSSCAS